MDNGIRRSAVIPDYTGSRYWANVLKDKLETYYHEKGFTQVKFWVESEVTPGGNKFYGVRSNIVLDCADLEKELK